MKNKVFFTFVALLLAGAAHAGDRPPSAAFSTRLAPSTALVEINFKHDDATPPPTLMVERATERCPGCGEYHTTHISGEDFMRDERAFERMGWVVAPDTVLINAPAVSERFIASIRLAIPNGEKVDARPYAVFTKSPWVLLKTDAPIPGAAPLVFHDAQPPPKKGWLMNFTKGNADWRFTFSKTDLDDALPVLCERRGVFYAMEESGLFLAENGEPSGFLFAGEWTPEKPLGLPPFNDQGFVLFDDLAATDARIAALRGNGIHLATLNFRSPRQSPRQNHWSSLDDEESTVQYAAAYHLAPGRFLIPWEFKPGQMTRLESITLRDAQGNATAAEFSASLENFQAFIVVSRELTSTPLAVWDGDLRDIPGAPVLLAEITTAGGEFVMKHNRAAIEDFDENLGDLFTTNLSGSQDDAPVFNARGELLTLPLARFVKYEGGDDATDNFPAAAIVALVANPPASELDAVNIPRSARDENRVAWLGVELQPLSAQLAQALKIAHLTQVDGSNSWRRRDEAEHAGAIAAFVYPGSPAEKAGIKAGDVLLRFYAEGRPFPYPVAGGDDDDDRQEFPWQMYDKIDVEDFMDAPTPWPAITTPGNQLLTIAALGRDIRVAGVSDGVEREFAMRVELAPDTYESAPQFEAEALGLHARDITFEVRHYFRRDAGDPGVIVSRVEPGSQAAVAGIKPYEMIVKVNDVEVRDVAAFEGQLRGVDLLRLTVRRMNRERIVRIDLTKAPKPKGGFLKALQGMMQ